jgi:RimJ/RimL family protein N-acetyltransferase
VPAVCRKVSRFAPRVFRVAPWDATLLLVNLRQLETERLVLRRWNADDRVLFAALNADPEVMEFFPATLSSAASDAMVDRIEAHFDEHAFGLWAIEPKINREFAGFLGLWPATFEAQFTPAVEVGWRLAKRYWGQGYATEGARAAMEDGFDRIGLSEIVSFTTATNLRSRRVMEKLGMAHDPRDDFEHPSMGADDPLRPHVLYRLGRTGTGERSASTPA